MTPIINPYLFYAIEVCENIGILCVMICLGCIVSAIVYLLEKEELCYKPLLYGVAFGIIAVFIPSKETCYKMVIAQYVTENNIKLVQDKAEVGVDYIFQKIDEMVSKHLERHKK